MHFVPRTFRFVSLILVELAQIFRKLFFFVCSLYHCKNFKKQPVLAIGRGKISIAKSAEIGVNTSPFYLSSYCYIEARHTSASITIESNVKINNNFFAIANTSSIYIGEHTLIGLNVGLVDSDFHRVNYSNRGDNDALSKSVYIGKNVFIGNDVKIYKGVTISDGAVVAAGSVVFDDVAENSIVSGNPAKFIKLVTNA